MRSNRNLFNLSKIINSSDNEKKHIIDNYQRYGLDKYDLVNIINSISDDYYKIYILKNVYKFDFNFHQILSIIDSIISDSVKIDIIKDYRKYNLKQIDLILIIESMNDLSIKNLINHHLDYDLTDKDIAYAVSLVNDNGFKKDILNNYESFRFDNDDMAKVIASISDDKYKKTFISTDNSYSFDSNQISYILSFINDDEYKFDVITNYKKYGLSSENIAYILNSFDDLDSYLLDVLNNYKNYDFNNNILASIISLANSDKDKEKIVLSNDYNFSPVLLCKIVSTIKNPDKRNELMNKFYDSNLFGDITVYKKIQLPDDITIGIEIETEGINSDIVSDKILPKNWNDIIDATLDRGIEVVSPILHSGDEKDIYKVCVLLDSFEQEANRNCAAHVHIGSSYFENNVNCYKNLIEICTNCERIIYLISNEEGDIPRNRVFKYASPITNKISNAMVNEIIQFDSINDIDSFIKKMSIIQKSKFSSVNLRNVGLVNKDTIEFRTSNGTINPDVWIDNINLFGSLVFVSKYIANIQNKAFKELSDNEKVDYYFYQKIKDDNVSDRNRLIALLNLFPQSVNKRIYINRYDVNSELIKGLNSDDILTAVSSLRPISITKCSEELKVKVDNSYKEYCKLKNNKLVK